MVSVIIPVYNRGHFIKRLRATVDSQTYKDVEILIYDDGSFDGTEWEMNQVLKRSPDPKVRFFELDHKGPSYARNCGIKAAKGEYVAFLDSDDYWTEHHLQRSIHCIETNKADGCYGGVIVDGAQIKATAPEGSESWANYLYRTGHGAHTSTIVMTTESAKATLWDEELIKGQNYDFILRYVEKYKLVSHSSCDTYCDIYWLSHDPAVKVNLEDFFKVAGKYKSQIGEVVMSQWLAKMYEKAKKLGIDDKIVEELTVKYIS